VAASAAPQSYQQSAILTAPPGRLVVMLYDGANRFLRQSAAALRAGEVERSHTALQRAQAILDELLATLNMDAGEIARSLADLYLFCRRELDAARTERDPGRIDVVADLLAGLRESFAQIEGTPK
jgi:flagellar secretion chaperone FliS